MSLEERTYEMPLETEDSFRIKVESGEIRLEEEKDNEDDWLFDNYFEESFTNII